MKFKKFLITFLFIFIICTNNKRLELNQSEFESINYQYKNTNHYNMFGKYAKGYNKYILKAIDLVQSKFPDGGGYFIGIDSIPPESPIGYDLSFLGKKLLDAPRKTSYCSGSTYAVFIEALNMILNGKEELLDSAHYEAIRMQEPDGGRREDKVKLWGNWNADGFGSYFALVEYTGMGTEVKPKDAIAGDFMNISWKSGIGHSVIFLSWIKMKNGESGIMFWSSQKSTNGMSDMIVPISRIAEVKIVRLTNPENIFTFDINKQICYDIPGDTL